MNTTSTADFMALLLPACFIISASRAGPGKTTTGGWAAGSLAAHTGWPGIFAPGLRPALRSLSHTPAAGRGRGLGRRALSGTLKEEHFLKHCNSMLVNVNSSKLSLVNCPKLASARALHNICVARQSRVRDLSFS